MQAELAEEQEMVEEYGGAWPPLRGKKALSAHDSFLGGRAGGAKASEEKGPAEQFDNPVHGEGADDSET